MIIRARAVHAGRRIMSAVLIMAASGSLTLAMVIAPPPPVSLALVGGRVYAAPDVNPLEDAVVLMQGGRITAVGRRADIGIPAGVTTIDCAGLVVTAGFQNSHIHLTPPAWIVEPTAPANDVSSQLQAMLTRWGFTTVVDTGSDPAATSRLRRRIESGEVKGPRILTAGLPLYPPKGVPFYLQDLPAEILRMLPQPATPDDAAALVRDHPNDRDLVKLFVGSWVTRERVLPMPDAVAISAAREAHAAGKVVFAHASNVAGLEVALEAGVDVLAHALDNTDGFTPAHLERMKRQNLAVVPTLKLFGGWWRVVDWVRNYARAGGQILFGTDVGYLKDLDPTDEYVFMASAGLGYREILAALTTNAEERFGEFGRRGRVAPGQDADLVILGSDPTRGAAAFADVRYTIRGGQMIYDRAPGESQRVGVLDWGGSGRPAVMLAGSATRRTSSTTSLPN
jgi:imidazolonepropionase-like amidohydrolase